MSKNRYFFVEIRLLRIVLAYYSTLSIDTIMIHTSFDCVSSPKENDRVTTGPGKPGEPGNALE